MKNGKKLFAYPYKRHHNRNMAKRYTDSEKWKKDFIRNLPTEYKVFWLYLLDECDHAGIWHVEIEIAEMRLGIKLSIERIRGLFKEKVVEFDGGNKWFVPDFISFQYGVLDVKNRAHKSVIDKLEKYNLLHRKGLGRVLQDPMDKDKDKDSIGNKGVITQAANFEISGTAPPVFQVVEFFMKQGKTEAEAMKFYNHHNGLGWMKGISPIKNWASIANNWIANDHTKTLSGIVKFRGPAGEGTMPAEEWAAKHENNPNSALKRVV